MSDGIRPELLALTELSHEFGTPRYVRAGGGNTSFKEGNTLWVKPSGCTLAGLTPDMFVVLDRARLSELYNIEPPADSSSREALVKDMMASAALPSPVPRRASVEAALHDSLSAAYVVHTHPAWVNGLTCSIGGAAASARIFPDALYLPYTDPGYTLCMAVRKAVLRYRETHEDRDPEVILLENHGIFVSSDTPDGVRRLYAEVETVLSKEYAAVGIDPEASLRADSAPADTRAADVWGPVLREAFGDDAAAVVVSAPFPVFNGPLNPDQLVYAKAYLFDGVPTPENLREFSRRRGYAPRIVAVPGAVLALGKTEKAARLALDLAEDSALIARAARAFGGVLCMDERARRFIETWEAESYRSKQV